MRLSRVGEVLIQEGAVSAEGLRRALAFQRYGGQNLRLGTILIGWNLADEETLLRALSRLHGCEAASWSDLSLASRKTTSLLPAATAERFRAIPYKEESGAIRVAFANPSDLTAVDRVSSVLRRRLIPVVALEVRILQAHALFYGLGIPADHRPILFKLRQTPDKMLSELLSTPTDRVGPIHAESSEASWADEPRERESVMTVSSSQSSAELASSNLAPSPAADSETVEGWETAKGLWLVGEDAPEDLADLEPHKPQTEPQIVSLPRPSREEVARAVLKSLLQDIPRTLVFGLDQDHLLGVYGRGAGISPHQVRRIHLLPADGSILQRVAESRTPHFGRPAEEFWPAALALLLGLEPPECAVLPLESMNGLVGVLYADRAGERMHPQDLPELTRAAAFLANALASPLRAG